MSVKISHTILYVQNVRRSMSFYQQTFGYQEKLISPTEDYGELATGDLTLAFATHNLAASNLAKGYYPCQPETAPPGFELCFETVSVDQVVEKALANGATEYQAMEQKSWGQTVAYLRDPDGFLVAIGSPVEPQS